ncbi:hypothetical protein WN943_006877 [Citrus x changshan-huyou]
MVDIVKEDGPLTVAETWERAKVCVSVKLNFNRLIFAGASGLTGKSHMKIVLRWMRERQKLRLVCNHVGPHKQILYTTWFAKPNNLKQPKSGNDPSPSQP